MNNIIFPGRFVRSCTASVLLATTVGAGFLASPAEAVQLRTLAGQVPAAVANLQPIGPLNPTNQLSVAIGLPLRDPAGLNTLLQQLYDPSSANYRQFLTTEQFTDAYGPSEDDYQAVMDFATTNGLSVTTTYPNRMIVDVSGTVAQIEAAFHVSLQVYQEPGGNRTFYAPNVEPTVSVELPILGVSGLNNYAVPRPRHHATPIANFTNAAPQSGSGPSGTYMGLDFRAAYAPGSPFNGAGQSVGLLQFDGYTPADITYYETQAGLPSVTLSNVLLDGFNGKPTGSGGEVEVSLDIEMSISMGPGLSKVIVYMAGPAGSWHDILNRMASDNLAKQLSCSWYIPGGGPDPVADQIFMQMGAQGQAFFDASGDADAFVGPIDFPGDTPYITQVGGTTLTTSGPRGAWVSEKVWNWGNGTGSGGGISTSYALPIYQTNIDMTANKGSTTKRNVPDVALTADNVYVRANGADYNVGGTSCAAPLWAGFCSLINQAALANGAPIVGFVNPSIYTLCKTPSYTGNFHDITVGNNQSPSSPVNFVAVAGYDLCTGWGTPLGTNLILSIGVPEALRITPSTDLLFTGPAGGPILPASQTYTLTNKNSGSLDWNVSKDATWLSVSVGGGTLTAGGPATNVVIKPNIQATNLAPGAYVATLTFSNLTDGFPQTRRVTMAIVTQPIITSEPDSEAVFQGMTASFTVGTASNALEYYQWYFDNGIYQTNLTDGGNISGSGTATLTIGNVSPGNVGAYTVIVTNAAGSATSTVAYLTIVPWRPVITVQPTNQTILPGSTTTFSVAAVGTQPFTYRWQLNGTNLTDGGSILGSGTSTLTVTNATAVNVGTYRVLITNSLGSDLSAGATLALIPVTAPGVTLDALYSFAGSSVGFTPFAGLMQARDGGLYGTTIEGGSLGYGTVFRIGTNGGNAVLVHSFSDNTEGAVPYAPLIQGSNSSLYGVTYVGGSSDYGTVFRMATNGANTTLQSFSYATSGGYPVGGMFQAHDGNYYGTTLEGGLTGYGTLFRVTPANGYTTLRSFNGTDAAYSSSMLMQAADGYLYGTAESGGTNGGWGTIFRATLAGVTAPVASFGYTNGSSPVAGLVQDTDGTFYGTAYEGGANAVGTVFKLTSDGTLTAIYSFTGGNDGANPFGGLLLASDGNLYGTTGGGGQYGSGTIFRISPSGTFVVMAQFDGFQGAAPECTLMQAADGSIYGTASSGGQNNEGTVYRLSINAPLQITQQPRTQQAFVGDAVTFSVATFGSLPVGYQWRKNGQPLSDGGTIAGSQARTLALTNIAVTDAALYSVVVSNSYGSVTSSAAALQIIVSPPFIVSGPEDQTVLAGGTAVFSVDAEGDAPLSYQWQKNGTNIVDAGGISGSSSDTLVIVGANAASAGSYSVIVSNALEAIQSDDALLTVVPIVQPGGSFAPLHAFSGGTAGFNPVAGVIQGTDGLFYGTTLNGGSGGYGIIYKMAVSGAFSFLHSFTNGTDGANPIAGLTQGADGNYYGAAYEGTAYSAGAIFKMNSTGSFSPLYDFLGGNDGGAPGANLIQGRDGRFYGTTYQFGTNGYGGVFAITTNGALTPLAAFASNDGANPVAPLVQGTNGVLYGVAFLGGAGDWGTFFSVNTNGGLTALYSFDYTNGANPAGGLLQLKDGAFYGTAESGGTNGGWGTVFRITADGSISTLHSFNYDDGAYPEAGLIRATDGNLYGTTSEGGVGGQGTMFRITTNGVFSTVVWFYGTNGASPFSPMLQAKDGSFWGTTEYGGAGFNGALGTGNGLVYRLVIPMFTSNPFTQAIATVSVPYSASLTANSIVGGGDPIVFSKVNGPAWLSVAGNGALSGTPAISDIGTNAFVVNLSDTNGWSVSAQMYIPVVPTPWINVSLNPQGGTLWLNWSGRTPPYQVQMTTNPITPAWTTITGPLYTNRMAITPTTGSAYYRVMGQ